MYLKKLRLWNWRKFQSDGENPGINVTFKKGLNLLIGENDSGKTAIVDAIRITLGTNNNDQHWITEDDFSPGAKDLKIECIFECLTEEEKPYFLEWLSFPKEEDQKVALRITLTANFYTDINGEERVNKALFAGPEGFEQNLPSEALNYIRTTYLKPLRDANSELQPGYRSRLAKIIENLPEFKSETKQEEIRSLFVKAFEDLESQLQTPVLKKIETRLRNFLSVTDNRVPEIESKSLTFKEVLRRLRLQLSDQNSGLGSSNILFMALELIALRSNKEIGPQLTLIEEIEAHLHPQAQLRVIKEFEQALKENSEAQYILTTHSPTLAASVSIKHLNVIYNNNAYSMNLGHTHLEEEDYQFLDRFLDATKANLFFAKGVILVEGFAENLLVPALAELVDKALHKYGISIINVQGTYFERFIKVFLRKDINNAMNFPVAVISDLDIKPNLYYLKKESSSELISKDEALSQLKDIGDKERIENHFYKVYKYGDILSTGIEETKNMKLKKYKHKTENVKVFLSKPWTLEHSILQSELENTFEKIIIDDNYKDTNGEHLKNRKEEIQKATELTNDRASQTYNAMLSMNASKAIAAQKLAKYITEQKLTKEELALKKAYIQLYTDYSANGLEYILSAIEHVTKELNVNPRGSEG